MKIQFNTDNNVAGDERHSEFFGDLIAEKLNRFSTDITRVEVYLTDEDGYKNGQNDKRCVLEARIEGRKPIAVTTHADSLEQAVNGAIDKLKRTLDSILKSYL